MDAKMSGIQCSPAQRRSHEIGIGNPIKIDWSEKAERDHEPARENHIFARSRYCSCNKPESNRIRGTTDRLPREDKVVGRHSENAKLARRPLQFPTLYVQGHSENGLDIRPIRTYSSAHFSKQQRIAFSGIASSRSQLPYCLPLTPSSVAGCQTSTYEAGCATRRRAYPFLKFPTIAL